MFSSLKLHVCDIVDCLLLNVDVNAVDVTNRH